MISTCPKKMETWDLRHEEAFGPDNAVNSLTGRAAEGTYGEGLWGLFWVAVITL